MKKNKEIEKAIEKGTELYIEIEKEEKGHFVTLDIINVTLVQAEEIAKLLAEYHKWDVVRTVYHVVTNNADYKQVLLWITNEELGKEKIWLKSEDKSNED